MIDRPLKINMVAPDFHQSRGGMQRLAVGLASALSHTDHVTVFTHGVKTRDDSRAYCVEPMAGRTIEALIEDLKNSSPDVWLFMDAGLTPVAAKIYGNKYAYFHGNDFLNPWWGDAWEFADVIKKTPCLWRFSDKVRRARRKRQIYWSSKHVNMIFTNSFNTKRLIHSSMNISKEKIVVAHPGIDDKFFEVPVRNRDHSNKLNLLTVSRLARSTRRKNVEGVLRSINIVKNIAPNLEITYSIIGDGNDRERLEVMAKTLGCQDCVHFLGEVSDEEMVNAYLQSDLMVLAPKASEFDVEGFGIVYLEANALGVPVLGSMSGGATDAISNGETGVLIDRSDPIDIAEGIVEFCSKRDSYSPQKIRAHAKKFTWGNFAHRIRREILRDF